MLWNYLGKTMKKVSLELYAKIRHKTNQEETS